MIQASFSEARRPAATVRFGEALSAPWAVLAAPWALVAIAAATLCARGILIGNPLIHIDEQFYLLVGQRVLDGALPYVDIWDRKPIGLFLIYALAASFGGDGIVAYQVVASLFCAATAFAIRGALLTIGADQVSALLAACAYPFLTVCFEGGGGQSPVFYNAFMAMAGWLVLSAARDGRTFLRGAGAMLLVGLSLQIKYTVLFEGVFFGLALMWLQWRGDRRLFALAAAMLGWIAVALLPSLAAIAAYAAMGHFEAFWQANVLSSLARGGMVEDGIGLLALTLAPLIAVAAAEWRGAERDKAVIVRLWLVVSLLALVPMQSFSLNYALPAMVPAAMVLGLAHGRGVFLARIVRVLIGGIAIAAVTLGFVTNVRTGGRTTAQAIAAIMARSPNCPYIFDGPTAAYVIARSCLPTRYAFPSHLRMRRDAGLIGADQLRELDRVLASRPGVLVSRSRTTREDSPQAWARLAGIVARHYRLAGRFPYKSHELLVYALKDNALARPNCVSGCRPAS